MRLSRLADDARKVGSIQIQSTTRAFHPICIQTYLPLTQILLSALPGSVALAAFLLFTVRLR